MDKTTTFAPWNAVLPVRTEFEASMPFMWPEELQSLLPKPAKDILKKQQAKFQREWGIVAKSFPDMLHEESKNGEVCL